MSKSTTNHLLDRRHLKLLTSTKQLIIGTVDLTDYPVLQDFNSLWDKIKQDNNLVTGRNYRNHTATWYGLVDYAYTGVKHKAQDLPAEFAEIARDLEDELGYPKGYFNSLLINSFTNKGIGAHSDNESIFVCEDGTIGAVATISLGGTAFITITKNNRSSEPYTFKVSNGDLYVMPEGEFQNDYKHAVSASSEPRISLTFRHTP